MENIVEKVESEEVEKKDVEGKVVVLTEPQRLMLELSDMWGEEPWWFGIRPCIDDCGGRIEVVANIDKFPVGHDSYPREYKGYGLVFTIQPYPLVSSKITETKKPVGKKAGE